MGRALPPAVRHAVLVAYALGVLVVMFAPVPATPDYLPGGFDKWVHLGLFLGAGFLAYWDAGVTERAGLLLVTVVVALFAGLIEVAQGLLPYRSGDVADFVAGALGALVGAWVARLALGTRVDSRTSAGHGDDGGASM